MSKRKPKLGQNFLASPAAAQHIVEALGDIHARTVIEIGPGRGALTSSLAARAGKLIAVELDRELAPRLRQAWDNAANVRIEEANILAIDFTDLRKEAGEKLLVVGNLPYYLTSDILLHLFASADSIAQAVVMVQEEVADRLAAHSGASEYGWLSATAQMHARVEKLFSLPPEAFRPPPKVRSAVVRLRMQPRFKEFEVDREGFLRFLQIGFRQKRKTLLNNLKAIAAADAGNLSGTLEALGLAPGVRAEAVRLEDMARLYRQLRAVIPEIMAQERAITDMGDSL
jgi:16S rRNA (adenine1518-N6/adenine1519-N6)-dimethyltransferase